MTQNNNLSVLAWYNDIKYQNHRLSYAYGNVYSLISPHTNVLPNFIIREHRTAPTITVNIYTKNDVFFRNITTEINEGGLQIFSNEPNGYDVIFYPGLFPFAAPLPEGLYYLVASDGVQTWYSEVFNAVANISDFLKITYYDEKNLITSGQLLPYELGFKNVVYLQTELGKPEYAFEEKGETRQGYFFPEEQVSEKTYKFTFLAPEFLCDALRIIRLSDYVFINSRGRNYDCDTFLISPKWQTQGDIASVEAEFQCATVVKKYGRGRIPPMGGDFNNDFNNDFDNE